MALVVMWAFAAVVLATCFFRRQEICSCRKQFVRRWTLCLASWSVTCDEKPRHCATIEKHLLKTYDPPAPFSGISCLSIPSTRHSHHSRLKTCMLKKILYANKWWWFVLMMMTDGDEFSFSCHNFWFKCTMFRNIWHLTLLRCITLLYFAIRLENRKGANKRIYLSFYVCFVFFYFLRGCVSGGWMPPFNRL